MAAVLLRRPVAMATLAALATGIVPTAVALAAPAAFAASSITTSPAPDSSNVVHANRPQVTATFNANLAASSSITLVAKGSANNLCSSFQVSGKQVSCTPTSDLKLKTTYDAVGHGVSTSGAKADTAKLEFTVSYPAFEADKSTPIAGGSVIKGNETLTAQFDQPITGNSSDTFAADGAFKVFEVNADGSRGTQLPGAISFGGNQVQGSDGSVSFKPSGLADGKYEAVVLVFGEDSSGKKNPAAVGGADYYFWVNGAPPANLTSPPVANNVTAPAFPFSGTAAPGLTVTVTVPDPSAPGGLNDASGSGVVPPCDAAPACPWTVKVDISGLSDGSYHWQARTSDDSSTNKSDVAPAPGTVTIDQSAPSTPTNTTATISSDSRTVAVTATHASGDTDITTYHVTITDQEGNKVEADFPAVNEDLPSSSVDVTTLDDGTLTVLVQAQDAAGNRSDPPKNPPLGPGTPTVQKNQGLFPNLGTSEMTTKGGGTVAFADAASGVQTPTKVTLRFTQPIKLSYTDNTKAPPQTHSSNLCVATTNGNCVTSGSPTLSDDGRGLVLKVNNPLPDRVYELVATTYSKNNCPDVNPPNKDNCTTANHNAYSGVVLDSATGQPYTFVVDTTPPTVAVTSVNPNPITSRSVTNVSISGTVAADAKTVSLVITSDGGRGSRLANAAIALPAGSGSPATWSARSLDLSALPDGRLTIRAKATDGAGNSGTGIGHARLQAHGSRLTESVATSRITAGRAVLVTGRLTDQNRDAISSATVTVQPRYAGGKLGKPTTATTDSKGRWSTTQAPLHNATFVATYDGSRTTPVHDAATTSSATVAVRALVTITSPRGKASTVQRVVGAVKPNKKGARVSVYRKTGHGSVLLGSGRLNKRSRFSVRVQLPTGRVTIFAKIGKTAGNAAGRSRSVRLAVS